MVNTVLNAKNYDRLADMVRLAHSLGADILVVTAMRLYEENLSWIDRAGLRLNNRQKRRLLTIWKEVEKVARSCGLEVKQAFREGGEEVSEAVMCERPRVNERERPEVVNPFLSAFCFAPFYSLTIYGTGAVGLCHTFPAKPPKCPKCGHQNLDSRSPFCEECGLTLEIVYGLRTQKLKKVWYGEYSQFVRKCLGEGKPFENACEVCGRRTDIRKIVAQLADHLNQCDGVKGWKIK
jgi:MoaA/NifB/PqqE/SkfB family radical SAM enzyme